MGTPIRKLCQAGRLRHQPTLTTMLLALSTFAISIGPPNCSSATAAEADLEPILRVDTGGPSSYVTSLAFSGDSQTLYAAGWDKIVRAWSFRNGRYVADQARAIRVPLGPRLAGAINAVAVSPDGRLIAVAGRGLIDGETGFRQLGISLLQKGTLTPRMQLDQGVIYLFDTTTREFKTLRGHRGPVLDLAFDQNPANPPTLASAAYEPVPKKDERKAAVRLWDVASRKYLRGTFLNVDNPQKWTPDLAVWRTGQRPTDCRVAIAWNDGKLSIWNTLGKNQPRQSQDGALNNAVVTLPNGQQLLTTSYPRTGGRFRFWSLGENVGPQTNLDLRIDTPDPNRFLAPRAMAVVEAANGRALAAVAAQAISRDGKALAIELQLYDLDSRRRVFRRELWKSTGSTLKRPTVAFAPNGQFIAVAGAGDHGVRLFRTNDLLNQRFQPELLRSDSTEVESSHFVRRNQDRGIYFVEAGTNKPFVFDLSRRLVVPLEANSGWNYDRTVAKGWSVQWQAEPGTANANQDVTVRSPTNRVIRIKANAEALREITAYAVLPPSKTRKRPVLALASQEYGQPTLALHDLTTGEPFRVLYGHTEQVRHLSFSADGRLLLSSGEDQTVRVWSLTDVDTIIGRHGELMGIAVDDDDDVEGVIVADVEEISPHKTQLRNGDHILGVVQANQLIPTDAAREFYELIREFTPNSRVTLRISRNGQQGNVALLVNQALDERKPLFSFLVTRAQPKSVVRRWIAWSPIGPFESSDETVERYLGWHFNTGDPNRPTSFADLNQYRDEYYREGLLRDLITFGELTASRRPEPIARPQMSLAIAELGAAPKVVDGQLLVQDASTVTLSFSLGFNTSPAIVDSIECSFDNNRLGVMRRVSDSRWELDVSNANWTRGSHQIVVQVNTNEIPTQAFSKQLLVRFQPAPPVLDIRSAELADAGQITVQSDSFDLAAQATPFMNEPMRVTLYRRNGKQREIVKRWDLNAAASLEEALTLVEGSNHFILEAVNTTADENHAWLETSIQSFSITRTAQPRLPVRLTMDMQADGSLLDNVVSDRQFQIRNNGLTLLGRLTGQTDVAVTVVTSQGESTNRQTPQLDVQGDTASFSADVSDLAMDEPAQILVIAQANDGTVFQWQTTVNYTPPLPQVEFIAPTDRTFFSDEETENAAVAVRLVIPDDVQIPREVLDQLRVQFVNNDGTPADGVVDVDQATATGQLTLVRGPNSVRAILSYANRAKVGPERSDPILLSLNTPPSLDDVQLLPIGDEPQAKLLFTGKTSTDLPTIRIGPYEVSPDDVIYDRDTNTFEGQIVVPLQDDRTLRPDLQLEVRPRGTRRSFAIDIDRPSTLTEERSPPSVEFVAPQKIDTTAKSQYLIAVETRSKSPFARLQVLRQGNRLVSITGADLQKQVTRDGDEFVIQFETSIPLEVGPNELIAVVHNVHSGEKKSATITRIPPLVQVVVDQFSTEDRRSIDVKEGKVDSPIANVHGRVIWRDADDPRLRQRMFVKLRINGFQQIAELDPPRNDLERRFTVPVLLAEPKNRIDVSLAGLQRDVGDFDPVFVECVKPKGNYRLHILVIGVGDVEGDSLLDDALAIFRAKRKQKSSKKISTPIYTEGWIYGALTGSNAKYRSVASRLENIRQRIRFDRPEDTRVRDVVMLYYTGGELVPKEHTFYLTTRPNQSPASLRRDGISSRMLTEFVEATPGAHVLMLDVSRECQGQCPRATWPLRSPGAMLRFAWIGVNQKPANFDLLTTINQISPENEQLGQVDVQLQQQEANILRRVSDSLVYENFIPDALRNLRLRTTPAATP